MKSMMERMSEAFQNAVDIHQTGLSATTDSINQDMQQIANDIRNLLEEAARHTNTQLAQRMADMEKASTQSIQTLQASIAELQKSMTSISSQTTEKSEAMIIQMYRLIAESTTRLDSIFKSGEAGVSELLQQQANQIKEVNAQIANSRETLQKSGEILQQIDVSVNSIRKVSEDTQNLSELLITSADRIEDVSEQLTEANDTFNEENAKYFAANRETTQQLQNIQEQSMQLLNDFAQRFQTIHTGLTGIFEGVEEGLTSYSVTTRESINSYLKEFSGQLTEAAAALNSGVEALGESVEGLTDIVEEQKVSGASRGGGLLGRLKN